MTYATLSIWFLGGALAVAVATSLVARRMPRLAAVGLTLAGLLLLTAVFDTIMIGLGFFTYTDAHLLGMRIGLAPVEDFAYPFAGAVLLPAIWVALRARRSRSAGAQHDEAAS